MNPQFPGGVVGLRPENGKESLERISTDVLIAAKPPRSIYQET